MELNWSFQSPKYQITSIIKHFDIQVDEDLNEGNDRWDTDDMDSILLAVVFGWIFILLGDEALSGC